MKKKFEEIIESARNLTYLNKDEYDLTVEQSTPAMRKSIQDNIQIITNSILNAIDYSYDSNVMIGSILKNFEFRVITGIPNDENVSGMIAVSNNKIDPVFPNNLIILNDREPMGHQKFTAAHELAHFLFDYQGGAQGEYFEALATNYADIEEAQLSLREYRANKFAAELLMPSLAFIGRYIALKKAKLSRDTIVHILSDDFGVTVTAIERRINELKLEAV